MQAVRKFTQRVGVRNLSAHKSGGPAELRKTTMNDLPTPTGSWIEHYNQTNGAHNRNLAIGVVSFVGAIVYMKTFGNFFFNYNPPDAPADS